MADRVVRSLARSRRARAGSAAAACRAASGERLGVGLYANIREVGCALLSRVVGVAEQRKFHETRSLGISPGPADQ